MLFSQALAWGRRGSLWQISASENKKEISRVQAIPASDFLKGIFPLKNITLPPIPHANVTEPPCSPKN
ncbi:Iduronate 2-sulfatase, partial [Clarias magur]